MTAVLGSEDHSPPVDDTPTKAVLRHRRATRWMHWVNVPLLTIMVWSGFRIY